MLFPLLFSYFVLQNTKKEEKWTKEDFERGFYIFPLLFKIKDFLEESKKHFFRGRSFFSSFILKIERENP